jgi:hypothetical protein
MARVKIEEIIDHLSSDMRRALEDAVSSVAPQSQIDSHQLYREFLRGVRRRCGTWERVPDRYVEVKVVANQNQ